MKKALLLLIISCLCALSTPRGGLAADSAGEFRPLVRHALELKERGSYAEAARAVERALAMDTDDSWPGLDHELARLYLLSGDYGKAEGACAAILSDTPGDREARRLLVLARARAAKGSNTESPMMKGAEGGPEERAAETPEAAASDDAGGGPAPAPSPRSSSAGLKLEAARLHGWSGDYDHAIALYREVLSERPGHREARRGLARTYAWAKDYGTAVEMYSALIEEDGDDLEARLGLARVYSWQGRYEESLDEHRYVIARDPDNAEARRSYARVLWWSGDPLGARAEARELSELDPGDGDTAELLRRLRAVTGPRLTAEAAFASDSDGNDLDIYRARAYAYLHRLSALTFDYSVYEASRHGVDGTAQVLGAAVAMEPDRWLRLTPRLDLVSMDSAVDDTTYLAGGLSARVELSPRLRLFASGQRSPLVDTAQLIQNGIRVDDYTLAALYDLDRATVSARATYGEYSDGNTRKGLSANAAFAIVRGGGARGWTPDVTGGYRAEYREFSERTASGYFNPPEIITHHLYLDVKGEFASGKGEYHANGRVGTQSYESKTEYTSAFTAELAAHLTEGLSAGAAYKWSRSALERATGFRYEELRFTLDYLY